MKAFLSRNLEKLGGYLVKPHVPATIQDPRTGPATKVAIAQMMTSLQATARSGGPLPRLSESGFRVFSQFEEDGYLVYLAAVLELDHKTFLDIGAADGVNSNCANLALNLGWHGLFIEGSKAKVDYGRSFYALHPDTILYPPMFTNAFITAENINDLVSASGLAGDIGICSIDIDGNDCWVWQALEVVSPAVVVIETHVEFGLENRAVPYDPDYFFPGKHPVYHGASPTAMVTLAKKKGYRLVGANHLGFNLIFVRIDIFPDRVPEVAVESLLTHKRYLDRLELFEPIKDWDYVSL